MFQGTVFVARPGLTWIFRISRTLPVRLEWMLSTLRSAGNARVPMPAKGPYFQDFAQISLANKELDLSNTRPRVIFRLLLTSWMVRTLKELQSAALSM